MTDGEGDDGGTVDGSPGHDAPDAPNASNAANGLRLRVHAGALAVIRLPAGAAVPAWASRPAGAEDPGCAEPLHVVARTAEETSLVLAAARLPGPGDADALAPGTVEDDFRALSVAGPLDFALVGILARLCDALARAAVPVFAVSTFDTDWLLVRSDRLAAAVDALRVAGARVDDDAS